VTCKQDGYGETKSEEIKVGVKQPYQITVKNKFAALENLRG
jgi:hypothetical protein